MFGFFKRQAELPRIGQIRLLNLFATLNPRELRIIDGLLHDRHYLKDEVVFDQGEEGQALYVVLSGKVLICRQGEPVTGRVAEIPSGALFGELALLDGAPRVAQARRGLRAGRAFSRGFHAPGGDARRDRLQDRVAARARLGPKARGG
jgi:CRP/FNR family transcriptional regulator, cyclic AMP receptor protein